MSLDVVRLNGFADAMQTWQDVLTGDPHATFFSTPTWLQTWWEHYQNGREAVLLKAVQAEQPVGFASVMVESFFGGQLISFLGTGLSDYADVLVHQQRADRKEVVAAMLDFLVESFPKALFHFRELPGHTPSLQAMQTWLEEKGLPYTLMAEDLCPVNVLPTEVEALHRQLNKSFLSDIRRGYRRLRERGKVTMVDQITPGDGDWAALRDEMADLQSRRMRSKGEIPMWQGRLGDFVKDILQSANEAGNLRLTGLLLDDRLIAYELCFVHNRTIYAWSRAFSEEYRNTGPGKIALLHVLETAIRQGYQVFDLLRGEESYKKLWTNGAIQNYQIVFAVRPSLGARAAYKYVATWKPKLQRVQVLTKLYQRLRSFKELRRA